MQQPPEIPPQFTAYPRAQMNAYGTGAQLRALYKGYNGLSAIFGINVALSLGANAAIRSAAPAETVLGMWAAAVIAIGLVVGFGTYPSNKNIAYGANWNPGMALLASILMAVNSALCCGIIGYVVVQQLAMNEMKRYGLKARFFGGIKKQEVEQVAAQLDAIQRTNPGMYPPPQA